MYPLMMNAGGKGCIDLHQLLAIHHCGDLIACEFEDHMGLCAGWLHKYRSARKRDISADRRTDMFRA